MGEILLTAVEIFTLGGALTIELLHVLAITPDKRDVFLSPLLIANIFAVAVC